MLFICTHMAIVGVKGLTMWKLFFFHYTVSWLCLRCFSAVCFCHLEAWLLQYSSCCCCCYRYNWTCSVFPSRSRSCFINASLDNILLPHSTDTASTSIIRPVTLSGSQLSNDASNFLFMLTVWKSGRPRSSTTQLLTTTGHTAGDRRVSEARLE